MARPIVGLALGGGAAWGLAHIGVIEVLEETGIKVDLISGTSAGAVIGALYAAGRPAYDLYDLAVEYGKKRLTLFDLSLPVGGIIGGRRIRDLLNHLLGKRTRFEDLGMPLACVATDVITGEEVVFTEGPLIEPLRATIAIPVVLNAIKYQNRYLVDGGLVNPVPVSVARTLGAGVVVAVNVSPNVAERAKHLYHQAGGKTPPPNIVHIVIQSVYIGTHSLTRASLEGADVVISPDVTRFWAGDFHRAEEIILEGRRAAVKALPEIKRLTGDTAPRSKTADIKTVRQFDTTRHSDEGQNPDPASPISAGCQPSLA